jgi:hypothetical protein
MLIITVDFAEISAKILYPFKPSLIQPLRLVYKFAHKHILLRIRPIRVYKTVLVPALQIILVNIVWLNALTLLKAMEILF